MATPILGLALPTTGSLNNQWGNKVNNSITSLLDSAVGGTTTLSTDGDVTLSSDEEQANQARSAILLWTAAGTVTRTITSSYRKSYVVINSSSTQSIKLVGTGPTTGVTIAPLEKCLAAWNGSDFVKVASSTSAAGTVQNVIWSNNIVSIANSTTTPTFTISGTSGGIPYFSSSTAWSSSALLGANALMIGGGVGVAPSTVSNITTDNTYLKLGAQISLQFGNSSNANYVALRGPATPSANVTWTLPVADGTNGQVLITNGSGTLSWSTVSGGGGGIVNSVAVTTANGFAGTSSGGSTPALTLTTTVTGLLKGSGTVGAPGSISAAVSGTDYAPATSGTAILYGNGSGGFSSVSIGTNLSFVSGTLNATGGGGGGGTVTSVNGSGVISVSPSSPNPTVSITQATTSTSGYLSSTDWNTFNGKQGTLAPASSTVNGYLSSTDWSTFNGKQAALSSTNVLPISSGGTGTTTAQAAMNAFAGAVTAGSYLRGNGTNVVMSAIQVGDVPTLNQNTTGTAANVTGTVVSANGGTGFSTYTTGDLIYASATNTLSKLGIGTANQVLSVNSTANGLVWAAAGGGPTTTNTLYGLGAGNSTTISVATGNTAYGYHALYLNVNGNGAVAIGSEAAYSTGAGAPIAIGNQALYTAGASSNIAIGEQALYSTQCSNSFSGNYNVAIGPRASKKNVSGNYSVAVGYETLFNNTTSGYNTAVGYQALTSTTQTANTAVGYTAGYNISTGDSNTCVGSSAGGNLTTGANNTCLGYNAQSSSATINNTVTLGDIYIATLRCATTSITAISDVRDKKDVVDIPAGLSFVEKLRPVSFKWAMRNLSDDPKFTGKQDIPEFGFIAQDLQSVQAETGITVPNLVMDDNPDRIEAAPSALLPILIKAIQELTARVKELEAKATQ
jgi:cytochrome c5